MKGIYLINYKVKGIKNLEQWVSLSFYKKTITKDFDIRNYNIKGIYGMNGAGKSAIISSVGILKNIISNTGYLSNPATQKYLNEIVNKKSKELSFEVEYTSRVVEFFNLFRYEIKISKNENGQYIIKSEKLSTRKAISKNNDMTCIFNIENGEISYLSSELNEEIVAYIKNKTANLLETTPIVIIFGYKMKVFVDSENKDSEVYKIEKTTFRSYIIFILIFGLSLQIYMDESDFHKSYLIEDITKKYLNRRIASENYLKMKNESSSMIYSKDNIVKKSNYNNFEKTIERLYEFIHIFKSDLNGIEIDKKEDDEYYHCNLLMIYDGYKIDSEFESTGIKKLFNLFSYINQMANGDIVFIDELDSNIHDVYLCALLEYLMEYGKGQLCFTTHNVGPMDILKHNKNSIDFLSSDEKIYSWRTSGNYSPSNLYRNGMIEGSPFNVYPSDFINAFGYLEE